MSDNKIKKNVKSKNVDGYMVRLRRCPISERKVRLVADMIRGVEVLRALEILKYNNKYASLYIYKLLVSAIANSEGKLSNDKGLFIDQIYVDKGPMLKRIRPAPRGRAFRIRKRSSHINLVLNKIENKSQVKLKNIN